MPVAQPDYDAVIDSPVGSVCLGIVTNKGALIAIDVISSSNKTQSPVTAAAEEVVKQLFAYFGDPQWPFSLSMRAQGSVFQQRVWQFMLSIPVGETRRYGEVAKHLNSAPRPVGGACRRNPIPIVVPCHRIVAASGIGGYNGSTDGKELDFKQWLLNHEQQ